MVKLSKKFILVILMIVTFLLTGCSKFHLSTFNASEEEVTPTVTVTVTMAPENKKDDAETVNKEEKEVTTTSTEETVTTDETTPTPVAIQPTANIDLPIYDVNIDTGDIDTVTALIPQDVEVTPELIVEKVVEAMADQSIIVGIQSVSTKDQTVIVNFFKDKAPVADNGSGYEASILDAIAQSLVDNLEDYSKVIFRVEGEAYVSGHIELGIDEVYLGGN